MCVSRCGRCLYWLSKRKNTVYRYLGVLLHDYCTRSNSFIYITLSIIPNLLLLALPTICIIKDTGRVYN